MNPHLEGALENQISNPFYNDWQKKDFIAENVMDWANNIMLGYSNLISQGNFDSIPQHLKRQFIKRIGPETSEYLR